MRPPTARWPPEPRPFHEDLGRGFGQTTVHQRQLHRFRGSCPGVPRPGGLVFRDRDLRRIPLQLADAEIVIFGLGHGLEREPASGAGLGQLRSILPRNIATHDPLAI